MTFTVTIKHVDDTEFNHAIYTIGARDVDSAQVYAQECLDDYTQDVQGASKHDYYVELESV